MNSEPTARMIRISGRVQGVFFRGWTVDQARELGVAGWVRNCPDGSVEARLSGDEGAVAQLIERMREGPSGARVDELNVADCEFEDFERFEVRH